MHLAVLIVGKRVLLEKFRDDGVRNLHVFVPLGCGFIDKLHDVEQLAGIASAVSEQGFGLRETKFALLQLRVMLGSEVGKLQKVGTVQRIECIDLATREQRSDHLEGGILRSGTDKRHNALLHSSEQRVLLRFGETMYLVDEQDGIVLVEEMRGAGLVDDIPDVLHTTCHRAEREERDVLLPCNDARQRRLPYAWRSPKDETIDVTALHHSPKDSPRPHQVPLSNVIIERQRTHSLCQRLHNASKLSFPCCFLETETGCTWHRNGSCLP